MHWKEICQALRRLVGEEIWAEMFIRACQEHGVEALFTTARQGQGLCTGIGYTTTGNDAGCEGGAQCSLRNMVLQKYVRSTL